MTEEIVEYLPVSPPKSARIELKQPAIDYQKLKTAFAHMVNVHPFHWTLPLVLVCDASGDDAGAAVYHPQDVIAPGTPLHNILRDNAPVAFLSHPFSSTQKRCSSQERDSRVDVGSEKKFRLKFSRL
ncbi:hypothetical protein SEPCBS119000_006465 [Sporothrix epigloea]|uniref:Reverse transcriptase/retrotransposon-derived protein RNase H-like domain-containing protein n=1 Tax=Sporothrix epigloea TaxID=1892477 RepID=A0ABP0E350_9PEZI